MSFREEVMTDFDKGVEYGITGFICGLVVQCLFFIPDWGVNKWIFSLVGIIIIIAMSVATYKDVMERVNHLPWDSLQFQYCL